ncbi:hypothetical protein ARAM_003918 [Aspergillus rambellii]|uniref:FAD/NAD(P)-binding domain-containing protein n=1 Tax=Aspergillus rambellii TaxID=308745 RepID=A0A0F8XIY8_9EURO|nr:hypothetical protein ARAM_003918 [Aspergillus rambellii]
MPRVVVVGAGFHGLIAAKTYLQVTGAYDKAQDGEIPDDVLIIDSAADLGGTWAKERLYPNLLSQNSYGLYEFSDLPLATAVSNNLDEKEEGEEEQRFIPGWKINQYLHVWCKKWGLTKRIRLHWKVVRISRLPCKQWMLDIAQTAESSETKILCDKLILATGLTSEPNIPDIPSSESNIIPEIHAKDVGRYCRHALGYRPIPCPDTGAKKDTESNSLRSVVVYGGAKSSFDFVHLFGSLHRNSSSLGLEYQPQPVQVHWVIREEGQGPAWMTSPTTLLGNRRVASDQAGSTRMVAMLGRCVREVPKRIVWGSSRGLYNWIPRIEGSWMRRLLHGNLFGRYLIRQLWKQLDVGIQISAGYDSQPKMEMLRPQASAIECTSPGGIANHANLWQTIQGPNVHIYRSSIVRISGPPSDPTVDLGDGTQIPSVDLIVHATGWKPFVPIQFDPPSLCMDLGLPCSSPATSSYDWTPLDRNAEIQMRQLFDSSLFTHTGLPIHTSHRLFRRIASPDLIEEGDHSFVVMGALLTGAVAVVAEVQALWAAAFLTGEFDCDRPLALRPETMRATIAEDVIWGQLTGVGLNVDGIQYNDMLMRDLGLNPYRMGGSWWREAMAVYKPSSYAGIVEEWLSLRDSRMEQSKYRS